MSYLAHHPDAADTVRGIVNWWLPAGQNDVSPGDVERALAQLVDEGRVTRCVLPDETVLYGRKPDAKHRNAHPIPDR
ncbi:hypothetical protein IQ288_31630 [Burkholderia sp. R-69980]|nr:hypothetical protein [Burkholderia sp. R-69980]